MGMNLTLSLDEPLAAQLREEASSRQVAPEEVARDILGSALGKIAEEKAWSHVNRRRAELIRKSRDSDLTAEESKELDQLQRSIDQHLEPMDKQLIAAAEQFRQLAEGLPDAAKP
jgi:hypothetical protein